MRSIPSSVVTLSLVLWPAIVLAEPIRIVHASFHSARRLLIMRVTCWSTERRPRRPRAATT
jgi:hypothetical protein